jgi:hypothetical protein
MSISYDAAAAYVSAGLAVIAAIVKLTSDAKKLREVEARVQEAERQAFSKLPELVREESEKARGAHASLDEKTKKLAADLETYRGPIQLARLNDLYTSQIERYQTETLARASWSFIWAIAAMISGFGFVIWGGIFAINNPGIDNLAPAALVSAVGGAVAAFIAKTFLDVHRLSLSQLNHYFRQPVINTHILSAQRIIEQIHDVARREAAYASLLDKVASLIQDQALPGAVWTEAAKPQEAGDAHRPRSAA